MIEDLVLLGQFHLEEGMVRFRIISALSFNLMKRLRLMVFKGNRISMKVLIVWSTWITYLVFTITTPKKAIVPVGHPWPTTTASKIFSPKERILMFSLLVAINLISKNCVFIRLLIDLVDDEGNADISDIKWLSVFYFINLTLLQN